MLLALPDRSIVIQTRRGREIPNLQRDEAPAHILAAAEAQAREATGIGFSQCTRRREPTTAYNCHGFTFGLRRTAIVDERAIALVLDDDGFTEVTQADARPGDVALYYDESGMVSHTGVVVQVERLGRHRHIMVLSKWGNAGEYIHEAATCPYATCRLRFVREGR
jgi:hypothetical protein